LLPAECAASSQKYSPMTGKSVPPAKNRHLKLIMNIINQLILENGKF
jgi:hypothetical protein